MDIINKIISQHCEDAAFLWQIRSFAVNDPHFLLQDLCEIDDRIEANIDGLEIAIDRGWKICQEELEWEYSGETFTAVVLALKSREMQRVKAVQKKISKNPDMINGMISAFGWLDYSHTKPFIKSFSTTEPPLAKYIGLSASAIHRKCRMNFVTTAAEAEDPLLRARAIRAVGEMGKEEYHTIAKSHLTDDDPTCRFWAAWSAALFKDISALTVLTGIAEKGSKHSEAACQTAMRLMRPQEGRDWLSFLSKDPEKQRLAIKGAGALGDPSLIEWLIEFMTVPELARPAGEAFTFITGVDLAYEDLETEQPENFEAGPTEDPEDENVDLDPDEDLPWPDPELVENWWHQNKHRFQPGTRYLVGKPITEEHLQDVLRTGYQRQRAAAAIELSMLQPGRPLFEVRAPGFRQKKWLGIR